MKKTLVLLLLFSFAKVEAQTLQSPKEFLGYDLGEAFTPHHKVVSYFEHAADAQQNVLLNKYGKTYEGRPLLTAFISSQENIDRLEQIRKDNLIRAGLENGQASGTNVAIVWLSYNVHGNESNSTETSMATLYELLTSSKSKEWLKNTVVIIDPCINPDGRDRYVNWYNRVANKSPNLSLDATEHREPWPGGRANHYLFDLNRDWAWQSQIESQSRMKLYNQWMPQIHVDFHEQWVDNPYYFAPAAEPYHEVISKWQKDFQVTIGKNHAKYFDKNGWLYFTKEHFDLLYPSYGDSYPIFNGAIGMTYEKAGGGAGGLAVATSDEDTLTLKDRIDHHFTTGISTVEISSLNAEKLLSEFESYFRKGKAATSTKYKSYVIKGDNQDKINALTTLLDRLNIQYSNVPSKRTIKSGFSYRTSKKISVTVDTKDLLISAYQPKSAFVKVLFEPNTKLADSVTYDITAWSIPYAHDLNAYAFTEKIASGNGYEKTKQAKVVSNEKPYAYLLDWKSLEDVKFLSQVLQKGVKVRFTEKALSIQGRSFKPGSLVITRKGQSLADEKFDKIVQEVAGDLERNIFPVSTGFADSGIDLGSGGVHFLKKPQVALLSGDQTRSLSFGEAWHFFERQLDYPVTVLDTRYFSRVDLDKYNVLLVPNGYYSLFNKDMLKKLSDWVSAGGRLILIQNALNSFVDKDGFALKKRESDEKKDKRPDEKKDLLRKYADREREGISSSTFGSIYEIRLDNTHPLAYGYRDKYFSLKTSSRALPYLEDGWNVGVIKNASSYRSGFVGDKVKKELTASLVFGVENKGAGAIVYMVDNPLYRAFWNNGKLMIANAVFMVGQ